jgi:AcrR family transcriptional regulator
LTAAPIRLEIYLGRKLQGAHVSTRKVIPISQPTSTRHRLVEATGKVLARVGFSRVEPEMIAEEADLPRALIYRYYGGLSGLVSAYGHSELFWPTVEELLGDDPASLRRLSPEGQMAAFFKRYLAALRRRPHTLEILAWEGLERTELTKLLEEVRVRTALEFFEHLHGDIDDSVDLSAIVVLLAGAVNFLALRSRLSASFGGIDLRSEAGWRRIEKAIDLLLEGTFGQGFDSP